MMTGYTKLFSSIIASTIWRESKDTKIVWITMLAMANKFGIVEASLPGLADMARVSVEEAARALSVLQNPDPYSRSTNDDGRRVKPVEGGWLLINFAKYRHRMSADERREYLKNKKRAERAAKKCQQPVNNQGDGSTMSTQSEAESESNPFGTPLSTGRKTTPPSEADVKAWASMDGIPEAEAVKFFHHFEATGWIDRNGQLIVNPRSKLKAWSVNGISASEEQKHHSNGLTPKTDPFWKDSRELDLVEREIKEIENRASNTATSMIIEPKDRIRYKTLRDRRRDLKKKLRLS